jgi:3-methylfumaryl-CoA hydratase
MASDTEVLNIEWLMAWKGRQETVEDVITPTPIAALAATLDRDDQCPCVGDPLPPLWHWLFFLPVHRQSEIGPDGHAKRGGFLPPVELPRRMWAGGRFEFKTPLRVGESVRRTSTIADISIKDGRSGPLVFVLVRHEVTGASGGALTEEHDIVYRGLPQADAAPAKRAAPAVSTWRRDIVPDDVLLFRYSALTFNGHRIHYDRRHVTTVEGYPGLIVHGPLVATLLADLVRRHDARRMTAFSFRAVSPLFDTAPFSICGSLNADQKSVDLWAQDDTGALAMEAKAQFDESEMKKNA